MTRDHVPPRPRPRPRPRPSALLGVRRLNFWCDEPGCDQPATFEVTRLDVNPTLGEGTIITHYCRRHLPPDALKLWEHAGGIHAHPR